MTRQKSNTEGGATNKQKEHLVYQTLSFCAGCVLYCLYHGVDNELFRTVVTDSMTLAAAVIGVFLTGKAWSDVSMARINTDRGDRSFIQDCPPLPPRPQGGITNG